MAQSHDSEMKPPRSEATVEPVTFKEDIKESATPWTSQGHIVCYCGKQDAELNGTLAPLAELCF